MQGTVVKYAVEEGDHVDSGDLVVVVEAMKMENTVTAHHAGVVTGIAFSAGDTVESGAVLARIESEDGPSDGGDGGDGGGDSGADDAADVAG